MSCILPCIQVKGTLEKLIISILIFKEMAMRSRSRQLTIAPTSNRYRLYGTEYALLSTQSFRFLNASSISEWRFTEGSWAMSSSSSIAYIVSLFGISMRTSKGNPPKTKELSKKALIAAVRSKPNSPYSASACFLILLSIRTLRIVVVLR